jgi:3-hydroxyacyl-[acyl-carrier-protein] dehydratase
MTTVTEIRIPPDHAALLGHFPDMPIVPGVVLLDETLHAIARLTGASLDRCMLSSVKFKSIVKPGQPVILRFDNVASNRTRFELQSSGRSVASGTLTLAPTA